MELNPEYDHLNFNNDKEILNVIGFDNLLFSDKIIKVNRYGFNQERNIIITENAILNFKKKGKRFKFLILFK